MEIPFWEKYTLSIDEAAAYFRIGRDRLYRLVNENPDADFVLNYLIFSIAALTM